MSKTTTRPRWITAGVAAIVLVGAGVPAALASAPDKGSHPGYTGSHEPPNIDLVRQQIYAYYGDPGKTGVASADSDYAHKMYRIERRISHLLKARDHARHHGSSTPTLLLDVDDTTLLTYNYEIYSNFAYDPTSNAVFVNGEKFPATFGMVQVVKKAKRLGYDVIYLTGRPSTQEAHTIGNLEKVGYPAPDAIYTRDKANPPAYLSSCAPDCTTIQYKSLTRKHINKTGNHIVANVGDQFSDLAGGFADRTFKLPNPMYYLP